MEIKLEGVFYVVHPEAISRQLPVVRVVPNVIQLSYSAVPGVD
jgi:hypothetical protein